MQEFSNVYLIGIGGIGMSALARYFSAKGMHVSGYDRASSPLIEELLQEGIDIHFEDNPEALSSLRLERQSTLVVYTPAVPESHGELQWFKTNDFQVVKRSKALGIITEKMTCLAVAGTHGKTTTSTLLAHIFTEAGKGCNAFLGGISSNYQSNLLLADNDICIVEADEYDRSFLQLDPTTAIVTSMDADHLDIYENDAAFEEGFHLFIEKVKQRCFLQGNIAYNANSKSQLASYGLSDKHLFYAENIHIEEGNFVFDFCYPRWNEDKPSSNSGILKHVVCGLPGLHNVENAVAAMAMAYDQGLELEKIKAAVSSFKGVKRRFDRHIADGRKIYIDDYAHHPTEIGAMADSMDKLYPNKSTLAIFQPHLFSRTRDFGAAFAQSLSRFDEIILLEIYPARELPIPGIDSQWLFDKISHPNKKRVSKSEIFEHLGASSADVVLTLGAGDIDRLVSPIKQWIEDFNRN